jgi:hypothetical protein
LRIHGKAASFPIPSILKPLTSAYLEAFGSVLIGKTDWELVCASRTSYNHGRVSALQCSRVRNEQR